ncbi:MAG: class I SAM-dependent methyltransferase [Bacteroidetes bacterium]|nr:MAG: class I SAM-dependent methyltransferase [Bacteroidota bacterium]TAG87076.1 MAG: class I SAM-dependent methyltransferase [Bacteroidota bacterium]
MKNHYIFLVLFFCFFFSFCQEKISEKEKYLLSISKENFEKIDFKKYNLEEIISFCHKFYKDTLKTDAVMKNICYHKENIGIEQDSTYFGSILYQQQNFIDLIRLLKDKNHKNFLDIGSGNGEKLFLALCLGFEKTSGIEYADSISKIAQKNWKSLIKNKKIELKIDDALKTSPQNLQADFVYMYSPIKDLSLMAKLYARCVKAMKNNSILLEVRMVYSQELRKLLFKNMPEIIGNFVLKKENNQFYYLSWDSYKNKKWHLLKTIDK